jgi:carbon storage regulator
MLVLSRKVGEKLIIGDNVTVLITQIAGNRVTIAIEAPRDVRIVRGELKLHKKQEQQEQEEQPDEPRS